VSGVAGFDVPWKGSIGRFQPEVKVTIPEYLGFSLDVLGVAL